jgi:NAD(P)-dependent dehydrogenase (short-subunit alcohol dehydrogenase family)
MATDSVLVTGCTAGGIGAALCHEFQRRGLHVFATARTPSKVGDLQKLSNVTVLALDVTSASSIAEAAKAVESKTGGRLKYLVNNSGLQYVMPTLDLDIEEAKRMYDVNVWGVIAMVQAFAPLVIAAKGSIVNIASIAGHLYPPYMGIWPARYAINVALTRGNRSLRRLQSGNRSH